MGPLLTQQIQIALTDALQAGETSLECSLDLGRSSSSVSVHERNWVWQGQAFPYLERAKPRTIYYWDGDSFQVVARFSRSLIKLVPTPWGPPTFEIDGIKMLPTAQVSPFTDARDKVDLIQPQGKIVLDTCGGLGYFAAWCVAGGARRVISYEKNPDVIWLRNLNPWSPREDEVLSLTQTDVVEHIASLASGSVDAVLHDPPRFGIAGELYSLVFYQQLARVIKAKGRLFHYTGTPNKLTSGRDVPNEVANRLRQAGFRTELIGDGVLAIRN
jgi:predicted methyltransferase